ncbi:amidohydrolase/deacetylase family metallohydrolase [Paenibacillus athensensis]|uniref:Dihydroorotase n=1 Tax=Paenibacillus athensensis TaxID=1967502 RepID=A0A4Y8PZP0_9BACL|nr:amidohydrolase/deacetylase family metallohydrolase [Paenibacillus athensensis]MCD1258046.1 amidohydrolase/deacetylase family metallohydrolase [Paenibacillus athensensis]
MTARWVLKGVKLVHGEVVDLVVAEGRIAAIAPTGELSLTVAGEAGKAGKAGKAGETGGGGAQQRIIEGTGLYVSSGWIDLHVHALSELTPYGDEMDAIGIRQGVTTIVDAGSCGADRIDELAAQSDKAATNVLALLNISRLGLSRIDELSQLDWIARDPALAAIRRHPAFIVGLKARISRSVVGDKGVEPLRLARRLADEAGLPLMVHIGAGPPEPEDIVALMRRGDALTHALHGKGGGLFDERGRARPALVEAARRGVRLDVGHGSASFSFAAAEAALRQGFRPDTISTDIYRANRLNGPVFSLAHVLTKFLALGCPLQDVIEAVTVRAAAWLGRPELGRLQVGDRANLTLFALKREPIALRDAEGQERTAPEQIEVRGAVADGTHFAGEIWAEAGY